MPNFDVFYSWQSDLPNKYNRNTIEKTAKLAISNINIDASFEHSPRLDQATEGKSGTPEIANTIYEKIETSGIFLADVSFVGKTISDDSNKPIKLLPNVNVLIELGYAARSISWDRVILVMNTSYGSPESLPFDLKNRKFPITYNLNRDRENKREKEEQKLIQELELAIKSCINAEHALVQEKIELLDRHSTVWMKEMGNHSAFVSNERETMGQILGTQRLDDSLIRLIDLKLIKTDFNTDANLYAYHWTYIGVLVLKKLGFRNDD